MGLFTKRKPPEPPVDPAPEVTTGDQVDAKATAKAELSAAVQAGRAEPGADTKPKRTHRRKAAAKPEPGDQAVIEADIALLGEVITIPQDVLSELFAKPEIKAPDFKSKKLAGALERFMRVKFEAWHEWGASMAFYVVLAWYVLTEAARVWRIIAASRKASDGSAK